MKLSIISPVYKASLLLNELVNKIIDSIDFVETYEIILVEDGSDDESWHTIMSLCSKYEHLKAVKFSRNFGQHYAITAGLKESSGDWVIIMDCDLQDDPSEISRLYTEAQSGYDIVYAQRVQRNDTGLKKLSSFLFYKVFGYLTDTRQDHSIGNFGIYSRRAINSVLSMGDNIRFFPIMLQWVGFKHSKIVVNHNSRTSGESTYSLKTLMHLGFNNVIAFSEKPLRIVIKIGFYCSLISFIVGLFFLSRYMTGSVIVSGFTSLIISIWFLSGIIISILGIIGIYLGKMFNQVKGRPLYIIEDKINFYDKGKSLGE